MEVRRSNYGFQITATFIYILLTFPNPCYGQFFFPTGDVTFVGSFTNFKLDIPENVTNPRYTDVRDAILEPIAEQCGTSRMCNKTGYDHHSTKKQCNACDKCYCDALCFQYGDCCLDLVIDEVLFDKYVNDNVEYTGNDLAECVDPFVKIQWRNNNPKYPLQRIFTKCPGDFHNKTIVKFCEDSGSISQHQGNPNVSTSQILANWPMTSKTSFLSYKNEHCAVCNKDGADLTPWDFKISCENAVQSPEHLTPQDHLRKILHRDDCEIQFVAPDGVTSRDCLAYSDPSNVTSIATCKPVDLANATSGDIILDNLCYVFHHPVLDRDPVYNNLFCFHCQRSDEMISRPFCEGVSANPFFLVFSPDALKMVQDADKDYDCWCPNGQVYDIYKEECRQLTCSSARRLTDNKECVPTVRTSFGLAYSVSLRLEATLSENDVTHFSFLWFPTTEPEFTKIVAGLKQEFLDKIQGVGHTNIRLDTFLVQLPITQISPNITITLDLFVKVLFEYQTAPGDVEERLLSLLDQRWMLQIERNVVKNFSAELIPVPDEIFLSNIDSNVVSKFKLPTADGSLRDVDVIDDKDWVFESPWVQSLDVSQYVEVKNTLTCPTFEFDIEKVKEVEVIPYNISTNTGPFMKHTSSEIELSFLDFTVLDNNLVIACAEKIINEMKTNTENADVDAIDVFGEGLVVTSYVCLGISALTLLLTFVTYCIFPSLQTLPGKCTMSLVLTLFLAITLFLVGGFFSDVTLVCQILGVATHFFLISSFTWMVICTVHMYVVFTRMAEFKTHKIRETVRYIMYFGISLILPAAVVVCTITANYAMNKHKDNEQGSKHNNPYDNSDEVTNQKWSSSKCEESRIMIGYGDGICYISDQLSLVFASALPIILLCLTNLILFIMTIWSFRKMTSDEKMVREEAKSRIFLYVKMSSLTGITWLPCTVTAFVSSPVIWYIFLILSGLQGAFVFASFVLNKRVMRMYGDFFREGKCSNSTSKQYITSSRDRTKPTST